MFQSDVAKMNWGTQMRLVQKLACLTLVCAFVVTGCSTKDQQAPDKDKFKAIDTSTAQKESTDGLKAPSGK